MPALRALVVEDDPAHRELLSILLRTHGFDVTTASDGVTALAILGSGGVDVVVADLNLPGLDGLELTCAARRTAPAVPVMVLTGYGREEPRVCALSELPGVAVEQKPPDFRGLVRRLRAMVESQTAVAAA